MFKNFFGANNKTQATNTIQGYLRASNQIEAINQQLEDAVNTAIIHGTAPWDAYTAVGYALAFVRACRCHVIVVQAIVQAPAQIPPLPRDAYNQAIALCAVFEPYLEEAIKAQDPRYRPRGFDWPLKFGPRLQESDDHISVSLVQGLRNGAQQLQEWVNGFIAAYELAVNASPIHPPESVGQHLEAVHREMQLGMFHFQTAVDMLGALSTTQVAQPQAESMLDEIAQSSQHRPQQQPTGDDDPLADITQTQPVPSKQQARPQQRNNDRDDLLSDITDGDREPLL